MENSLRIHTSFIRILDYFSFSPNGTILRVLSNDGGWDFSDGNVRITAENIENGKIHSLVIPDAIRIYVR